MRMQIQAPRYQGFQHTGLLPSLTAEWLETSPPNTGFEGLNICGLKYDNKKKKNMLAAICIKSTLCCGLANALFVECTCFNKRATTSTATLMRGIAMRSRIQAQRYQGG